MTGEHASAAEGGGVALAPGLYVTATPIGNARDITLRALDVLKGCDLIAAEDTRVTSRLLAIYGIEKPLTAYNDHNAPRERPKLLSKLAKGMRIALVSDAGTPLISDPGYKLVREAIAAGYAVHTIPGASSAMAALAVAGLPTNRFVFAGFLPAKSGERKTALEELKTLEASLVVFESPQRLGSALSDLAAVLGDRPAVVARELTKLHEELRRGSLSSLASHYAGGEAVKGEITIVIAPPLSQQPDYAQADALLARALAFMPVRAAADLVAEALSLSRRVLYERALAMREDRDG